MHRQTWLNQRVRQQKNDRKMQLGTGWKRDGEGGRGWGWGGAKRRRLIRPASRRRGVKEKKKRAPIYVWFCKRQRPRGNRPYSLGADAELPSFFFYFVTGFRLPLFCSFVVAAYFHGQSRPLRRFHFDWPRLWPRLSSSQKPGKEKQTNRGWDSATC